MIKIGSEGILVEGNLGKKSLKILWDLLDLIGNRFVIVAEVEKDFNIQYENDFKVVERNGTNIVLIKCLSENDLLKSIEVLSENCITDFHISVNSSFENIVSKVDSKFMFSEYEFLIEEYLNEFPRTIHVGEDNFFIDFGLFKQYIYQLQRVAKRYM